MKKMLFVFISLLFSLNVFACEFSDVKDFLTKSIEEDSKESNYQIEKLEFVLGPWPINIGGKEYWEINGLMTFSGPEIGNHIREIISFKIDLDTCKPNMDLATAVPLDLPSSKN